MYKNEWEIKECFYKKNPTVGMDFFSCCECCVLLGRGLCDDPITRPEESYRL